VSEIAVRGLTKRFGDIHAVEGLTFDVSAGQVTGFLGPNGAGKTTTFRMILGLIRPTAGEALIDGRPYRELTRPRRAVGAILEATGFHPDRSGRDHLRMLARLIGVHNARVEDVLDQMSLGADAGRRVSGYSLGMRQRLGLAAAILGDPAILMLDEPTNGLDPSGIAWLRALLRQLASEGRAVLVSSHVLSEVAQTVDRVIIVNQGQLRFAGTLQELSERTVSVRAVEIARLRAAIVRHGYRVDEATESGLDVHGATTEEIGRVAADEGIALSALNESGASLEEAFLRLTSTEKPSGDVRPLSATIR